MSSLEVNIEYIEQQTIYGLWQKSNDKTISKDIKALSKQYHAMVSMPEGKVLPYYPILFCPEITMSKAAILNCLLVV